MTAKKETMSESPEPAKSASSKKRKTQIDEIEVDLNLPEPPSKKAKRLLKKGKPLPVKPSSNDEAEKDDDLSIPSARVTKDGKEKKSQSSDYGIWIGNLPFTLTRVDLFKWLVESSGGMIKEENITRVNLPTQKGAGGSNKGGAEEPKQNKGFAYVDFDSEAASVAAMSLTETLLHGRNVLIKNATSFEGRPQKGTTEAPSSNGKSTDPSKRKDASKKIFVGNLAFQVTEDDLRQHFDKCGEIEWAKVATFEDTGKCKGFGWVKFKEVEAAEWAVKGFARIKEEIETEDDFKESNGDEEAEDDEPKEKKFQTRKWWVNRLQGRELKIDFAEDDQVRYKKRFGKDAPARKKEMGRDESRRAKNGDEKENAGPKRSAGYGDTAVKSYLTGSVVKAEGKKITFD